MNKPEQLAIPELASQRTVECAGPDLQRVVAAERANGWNVLVMAVVGPARYRLTLGRALPSGLPVCRPMPGRSLPFALALACLLPAVPDAEAGSRPRRGDARVPAVVYLAARESASQANVTR